MTENLKAIEDLLARECSRHARASLFSTGCLSGTSECKWDLLAGWDVLDEFHWKPDSSTKEIDAFTHRHKGRWVLGHFTYEFGQMLESSLYGMGIPGDPFRPVSLFVPRYVAGIRSADVFYLDQQTGRESSFDELIGSLRSRPRQAEDESAIGLSGLPPESLQQQYRQAYERVMQHLLRGDVYELNYCLPFSMSGKLPDPTTIWLKMQTRQNAPMAALYRQDDSWLLCCSPERFLKKTGNKIITQPIKGTRPRGCNDKDDQETRDELYHSEKERAENVMIVDLARNDLGRVSQTGTVKVEELFGIHSFPQVHQMISTVSAELKTGITFTDILKALFPMGSMTGAPKIRAMEIIRETETQPRGLFSGAVGYIDPEGDFDFNVVIRSIIYDDKRGTIHFPAGSAITAYSEPDQEYEECLLKARGMRKVLGV